MMISCTIFLAKMGQIAIVLLTYPKTIVMHPINTV